VVYATNGRRRAVATRHPTRSAYEAAKAASFAKVKTRLGGTSAPITTGHSYHGAKYHEHEYMRDGVRHLLITGREFIGSPSLPAVASTYTSYSEGMRLPGCVWPISPVAMGGRAAVFATEFEQHKVKRCRVLYEPSVPTTTAGAIAMVFRNDVDTETLYLGSDELQHAATNPSFNQFPVWEEAVLEIAPSDMVNRYFDSSEGEFKTSTQGYLVALAASDIDLSVSLGNFYMEYEIEFFAPSLSYEVAEYIGATMTVSCVQATVFSCTEGDACLFRSTMQAGYPGWAITPLPPGVSGASDWEELSKWMFYGTIVGITNYDPLLPSIAGFSTPDGSASSFEIGQAFWFSFEECRVGITVYGQAKPAAALGDVEGGGAGEAPGEQGPGTISWLGANPIRTNDIYFEGRWVLMV